MNVPKKLLVAAAAMLFSGSAFAACDTTTKKADLTDEEVAKIYECLKEAMKAGWTKEGDEMAAAYSGWKPASTQPASTGTHGKRFLMTFVNDVGFDEYVKYSDERGPMPAGTLIAKESFNVNKKGEGKVGPLFFMKKVAAGEADDFGNWVYSALQPGGKPLKITQKFCHDCHGGFEDQDALGYPGDDYRLAGN